MKKIQKPAGLKIQFYCNKCGELGVNPATEDGKEVHQHCKRDAAEITKAKKVTPQYNKFSRAMSRFYEP